MTTKKASITQWFIEPLSDWSNELIARLIGFSQVDVESMGIGIPNGMEKTHNVWQCTWGELDFIRKSQYSLNIRFRVWKRDGNVGHLEPAPDFAQPKPKKRRRSR